MLAGFEQKATPCLIEAREAISKNEAIAEVLAEGREEGRAEVLEEVRKEAREEARAEAREEWFRLGYEARAAEEDARESSAGPNAEPEK